MTRDEAAYSSLGKLWAIILAGGNGSRLRSLTERIAGDARPKQFCPMLGGMTFLTQTRRRVELLIPPEHILIVASRPHRSYYEPLLADAPPTNVLVQPDEHGTGAGILLPLLWLSRAEAKAPVALFPSDHYVSDDAAFAGHVAAAADAVAEQPDLIVLLGVPPRDADPGYGWIEPGQEVASSGLSRLYQVRRFWEKPSPQVARALYERGCLWNSFVMIGQIGRFLTLIRDGAPSLYEGMAIVRPALGTPHEQEILESIYQGLPRVDFSKVLLETRMAQLAVLRMEGFLWSDWGEPGRIADTLRRIAQRPSWADSLANFVSQT